MGCLQALGQADPIPGLRTGHKAPENPLHLAKDWLLQEPRPELVSPWPSRLARLTQKQRAELKEVTEIKKEILLSLSGLGYNETITTVTCPAWRWCQPPEEGQVKMNYRETEQKHPDQAKPEVQPISAFPAARVYILFLHYLRKFELISF